MRQNSMVHHRDDTNRILHMVGIPMIVGGTAGLLDCVIYSPGLSGGFYAGLGAQLGGP